MPLPAIIYKLLTQYFRFLAAGLVVVLVMVGYVLVIAPKITEVRSSQIATRQADADRLAQQQVFLDELKTSNTKFNQLFPAATLKLIDNFLPSDPDFPGLLLTVKNVIAQSGLTLESFAVAQGGLTAVASGSIAPEASGPKAGAAAAQAATAGGISVKTQDVSITVSGGKSYAAFKHLLTNIESSRRLFDIVSLNFSAGSETVQAGQKSGGSTWTLVLRTYYLPSSTR